jgi:hypothetical protein
MTNQINTEDLVADFIARGGAIAKCPSRAVVSAADRKFRLPGFSPDAARICHLNMLTEERYFSPEQFADRPARSN